MSIARSETGLLLALVAGLAAWACAGCEPSVNGAAKGTAPGAETTEEGGDPALPGVDRVDDALQAKLRDALEEKGDDYEPRTHHFEEDGLPTYTNRLILESSPYLLQHAHNPVNWFPWGPEALEQAKEQDKPIFLSVGYSTCHWCHVMERESFEHVDTAKYINEHFIPIKVDREERPDIDDIYMKAVHLMRGRGGWPMTVVLTPDREPFFGGTYFPRERFRSILERLVERYEENREEVAAKAEQITEKIRRITSASRPAGVPGPEVLVRAAQQLARRFDADHGGFGRAPKFPQPSRLEFLLRYSRRAKDDDALHMVRHTLAEMAEGGIRDHVGGGFHRYTVDGRWLVPHFEKMLYTNAQLAKVYLEAWQVTDETRFARVARQTLDYVAADMTAPGGGFYSATDADSETPDGHDEEGHFFTWTPDEVEEVLGPDRARLVRAYYDVTDGGNFEGRNILNTPKPLDEVASDLDIEASVLRSELEVARKLLYRARKKRPPPHRDEKILTAWNGMMISAFAQGALALDEPRFARAASEAAEFVWKNLRTDDGRMRRSFKDGEAHHRGYLVDYAALIGASLDLYEATYEPRWIDRALALQRKLDAHYLDEEHGGYYRTADDHEELLTRQKPSNDGSTPSGNSLAAHNLLRLAELTGDDKWKERAEDLFSAFSRDINRRSIGMTRMLVALDYYLDIPLEVLVVEPSEGAEGTDALVAKLRRTFVPNRVLSVVSEGELDAHVKRIPLLEGKKPQDGEPTAYVCERGRCELPTSDPDVFVRQLRKVRKPLLQEGAPPSLDVQRPGD